MKSMIAAIAMTIAMPAFAQSATPADAHDQHAAHADAVSHSGHAGQASQSGGHEGHDMTSGCCEKGADGKMACCEEMKAKGKAMACCEKSSTKTPPADPHAGHDMNQN